MKPQIDIAKIAKGMGGVVRGTVSSSGGYFGALNLAAEVATRFKTPPNGGRSTDPLWTERRPLPLRRETLATLEKISQAVRESEGMEIHPMQVAALIVEKAMENAFDRSGKLRRDLSGAIRK